MSLVIEKPAKSFDLTEIKCGYLLWENILHGVKERQDL